jgi:hypothetical protein
LVACFSGEKMSKKNKMKNYVFFYYAFIIFIYTSFHVNGQKDQFEKACKIIQELHGSQFNKEVYKNIIVSEKIKEGEFDVALRLQCTISDMGSTYLEYFKDKKLMEEFEKNIFKAPILFDPKTSKFYSKTKLNKFKNPEFYDIHIDSYISKPKLKDNVNGIFIEFIKFDGNVLRVDATFCSRSKIGRNKYLIQKSPYHYQFVFNNSDLKCINWVKTLY